MMNPVKLAISLRRVVRPYPNQKAPTADKIKINSVLRAEKSLHPLFCDANACDRVPEENGQISAFEL